MLSMSVYSSPYKLYEAPYKELCLIHHDSRRCLELRPRQNFPQPPHINRPRWECDTIMIHNTYNARTILIPVIDIRCQNEHGLAETGIAPHDTLNFTGLASEHWANNNAERHRTDGAATQAALSHFG